MNNKSIAVASVIFVLIIVGMFIFAYLKRSANDISPVVEAPVNSVSPTPYDSISLITGKQFVRNGVHTIVGEILMPTPCDLLNWDTRIAESNPEVVTIDFTVINTSEMCAQVMTPARFAVTFNASEAATVNATFQARAVELNLIPAGPNENPEDFELFIKG